MKKKIILSILALIIVLVGIGFIAYGYYQKRMFKLQNPIVTMEIADYGTVKIELYPEIAPNTVRNFVKLINEGYYNGLTFSTVESNLVRSATKGETTVALNGEFKQNGYENNTLSLEKGTLVLGRNDTYDMIYYYTGSKQYLDYAYNSGYSEFFITTDDYTTNNGYYCGFGKVIEGLDILEKFASLEMTTSTDETTGETKATTTPVNQPVITTMTVDTFGISYNEPEIIQSSK